jgi:hypothetical protein
VKNNLPLKILVTLLTDGFLAITVLFGTFAIGGISIGLACGTGAYPEILCYRRGDPPGGFWLLLFLVGVVASFSAPALAHIFKRSIKFRIYLGLFLVCLSVVCRPIDEMLWKPIEEGKVTFPEITDYQKEYRGIRG